jgi:23S rRNA pseudouridine1911/1915/1917 synthase
MEYYISKAESGNRIDIFLTERTKLSRSQIQRLIKDGSILLNDQRTKVSYKLKEDDKIFVELPPAPKKMEILPENIPLDIIYEDEDLLVVNKPRGMVTHPGISHYSGTLVNALLYHLKSLSKIGGEDRPGIVHRLDRDTSGLLLIAKNDHIHRILSKQMKERAVKKKYYAIVYGVVKKDEEVIQTYIGRHPVHRQKMTVFKKQPENLRSREAITSYKVLQRFKDYTFLELDLKTGRTHQIRVHLSHIGHPVVGDPVYGKEKNEFGITGQLLHAASIGFQHPRTKKYLEFSADLPKDMKDVLNKLSKEK